MIRVLIADKSPRVTDNVVRRLSAEPDLFVCATAADGELAVQEALRTQPDVAIIDAGLPGMDGIQTTEMLAQYLPRTGVIMLSLDAENEAFRHAMLAGAREFLEKPFSGDELVAAIRRVHEFELRKPALPVGEAPPKPPPGDGKVFTVVSGKGGVGKTVIAVNLALALARSHRVVLVDGSLQFGDACALLNLNVDRTIADLAASDAVADRDAVRQALAQGPGGLTVLAAPARPELADYVTTQHLRALMDELRRTFEYIIVDTPSYLTEVSLDAIETSDTVLLVSDMSVTSVKNAKLVQGVMEVLKLEKDRFALILNHRDGASEMERGHVEGFLRTKALAEIRHEPAVVATSVSHGVPFMLGQPRSLAATTIAELARILVPDAAGRASGNADDPSEALRPRRRFGFARP